jgi:integrase
MEVNVLRSCVRNRIGKTKTESSRPPVPRHPLVLNALLDWRAKSPYSADLDFLFFSVRFRGNRPLSPDSILEKSVRPALARIGVVGKHIGWHSFRHSLATNLISLGVDIKVAQELMRHSSRRTTHNIYTRGGQHNDRNCTASTHLMNYLKSIKNGKCHVQQTRSQAFEIASMTPSRSLAVKVKL